MTTSALMDLFKKEVKTENLLFYSCAAAFFFMPIGTAPMTIFAVLTAVIWLFSGEIKKIKKFYNHTWFLPIIMIISLHWIGLLYTPDPYGLGIKYARKTHYWIYCMAIASIAFNRFSVEVLIKAFLAGLLFNVFIAICQLLGIYPLVNGEEYRGFGVGYSILSAYLVIGILTVSYFFRKSKTKEKKIGLLVLMLLYFFHLVIMKGRNGYFTFLVLSPLVIHSMFDKLKISKVVIICVLISSSMLLSPVVRERLDFSVRQLKSHIDMSSDSAWGKEYNLYEHRFYIYSGAIKIFCENPIVGVGTGGYQTVMLKKGDPNAPPIAHPHNNFLYMAVSFGLFGIFAFLWFFFELIKNSLKQKHTLSGFFVLSTALVMLVSGLFNSQIIDAGSAFMIAVASGLQEGFPQFSNNE